MSLPTDPLPPEYEWRKDDTGRLYVQNTSAQTAHWIIPDAARLIQVYFVVPLLVEYPMLIPG